MSSAPLSANRTWRSRIVRTGEEAPDQLLAHPDQWKVHPQAQQEALAGILGEVGWVQHVIVSERSGYLIDGHARVGLAISRREPTVPVVYVDLSPEEERLVLATIDPVGALAVPDKDQLDALLRDVSTGDAAIQALLADLAKDVGLDLEAPTGEAPEPQLDRAEELRAQWGTERGQLWLVPSQTVPGEVHRLLCGDSTDAGDVAGLMAGKRAVLMATDPPYLVNYQGGNHPQSWHNKASVKDKHWDDYREGEGPEFFEQFLRVALEHALVPNAAIYQWHAHRRQALVEAAWHAAGLLVHQQIIWVKARAVLTHSHFMWQHEPCFYGWPEGHPPARKPPPNATTVWQIDQQGESDGIHPTQKPLATVSPCIEYHTERGEVCYEPFSGSGTCLVAAEQLGRLCYAVELAPEFVAVALQRLADMGLAPERADD
jgi:DNA modification methylase